MARGKNESYECQHIILDDGLFINCTSKNCGLEYSGGDTFVQNCHGENGQLDWWHAAHRTVFVLRGLGLLVQPDAAVITNPGTKIQ